jgi:hypothetical protein
VGLEGLLGDLQHHREALLDRRCDAGGHLGGGVPVVGAHGAAALVAGAADGLMSHQLVDDPGHTQREPTGTQWSPAARHSAGRRYDRGGLTRMKSADRDGLWPAPPGHGKEQSGCDGSGHAERGAHLIQHLLFSRAHLLGAEAQEAALLGGIGGRLGRGHQPPAERLGLLR